MPSMYAHQKFGNDVLCLLPKEVRERIAEQEDLYHIGLQGPDIFFYHKPLSWGEIPQYGNHLHDLTGHVFWGKLLKQYFLLFGDDGEMQERRGRARIYLYGVLCHYTLDSTCHRFIDETERTGVTTHAELEGDYDRRLIAAEGRDPVCEVLTRRFHPSREAAEAIAALYPEVTADIVEKTLHSCVSFQRLVLCRHAWKRNLIFAALRLIGKYDSLHSHIMNKEPDPDCREAEEKLDELYREALPNFLISVLLMYFFCIKTKLLPVIADESVKGLILPCLALAIPMCSRFVRQFRAEVLEQLGRSYVLGARARGVKSSVILYKNVLHNAMIPILTITALSVGTLLGGSVVVETIFRWPGLGKLVMDAITARDYPVIQGFVIFTSCVYVLINLAADICYRRLDPRVEEM